MELVERICQDPTIQALARHIPGSEKPKAPPACAKGLWGSSAPIVAAALAHTLKRPLLFVAAHMDNADDAQDDLEVFTGQSIQLFGAWELIPAEFSASDEILGSRLALCRDLLSADNTPGIISTSGLALIQPLPSPSALKSASRRLTCSADYDRDELLTWLVNAGYDRVDMVEAPGDFSVRGGVIDVFMTGQRCPVRIEFVGDTIESIRNIDLDTQRSTGQMDELELSGAGYSGMGASEQPACFLDYLPPETIIVLNEPLEIAQTAKTYLNRLDSPVGYHSIEHVFQLANTFSQIELNRFGSTAGGKEFSLPISSVQRFETSAAAALTEPAKLAEDNDVFVFCDNPSERQRLTEMFAAEAIDLPKRLNCPLGFVHQGFRFTSLRIVVVGHHEIFHRYQRRRKIRSLVGTRPVDSFAELNRGDYVVHVAHGIGRFEGLKAIQRDDRTEEFLSVRFAAGAVLHVPASRVDLIQRYIGGFGGHPPLSKLGTGTWRRQKDKVATAVTDLASELLALQAKRQTERGIAYPPDSALQREFEASFIYQETPDQLTALNELKSDMCRPQPMDRLLCGDVGYGKTELAIRAAFKAVEAGRQVAVLVPTTVLAQQHYRTFNERLADYPVLVDVISRFRTASEQKKIVARAAANRLDILIGTHRLLSDDVSLPNLGLVIIDEEQRFGVEHKERLKHLRETVDILTMTATPIPRTLHMGLMGLRDISSLASPPQDRRSIATKVITHDQHTIRSAILRELNRDGQVYFLYNRVQTIKQAASQLETIVPEARVGIVHGQMPRQQLQSTMMDFLQARLDVLVCSTIIESGLDIPTVNTIIIVDADRFGLAQLHQLRGRVGRYKHRAYAYMLLPKSRKLTPTAAKRLKAIEEYSELGSGFRIALRDLEIRGAGNILGPEQSGHIQIVGYEMYCQLLQAAVSKLKGQEPTKVQHVHLELGFSGLIEKSYVASDRQRIELYRRIVSCQSLEDLSQLESDIKDMFGPLALGIRTVLDFAEIRILADTHKISSIVRDNFDLIFTVRDMPLAEPVFADAPGSVRPVDQQTVYLRLKPNYFTESTLLAVLRKILQK